ncbi:MAG: hypothetical protein ACD_73C00486G0001 [uncultured bacterium]|nr:MAG: hypothetical protein ACD_73C00486G0001 [uncultured bacterium]
MVEYTNDDGIKYYLNYEGAGNLQGIPGKCVNHDTGEDIDCSEGMDGSVFVRWVPQFSIENGATVTDVKSDAHYYVKALEKEQQMRAVDSATCSGAGLELTTYELPDSSNYTAPNIGNVPNIDAAPAVIGGVLQ